MFHAHVTSPDTICLPAALNGTTKNEGKMRFNHGFILEERLTYVNRVKSNYSALEKFIMLSCVNVSLAHPLSCGPPP
jgi:hypothetical protein